VHLVAFFYKNWSVDNLYINYEQLFNDGSRSDNVVVRICFLHITFRRFSIDNSEYQRNGDYPPSRMQAQQDAANLILQCKLRANPESAVGVLAMAESVDSSGSRVHTHFAAKWTCYRH
jgi:hypothetical protein